MIICEQKAFERILSLGFCDTAIPITVRQEIGGSTEINVLPSLKKVAVKFEKQFSDNCFTREAHEFLRRQVRPFMDAIGYYDNRQSRKISVIMTLNNNNKTDFKSSAVIIDRPIQNKTTADVISLIEFGHIVAAKIVDNTIVAIAYTNLNPDGCKYVEIGVETAVGYRQRGYAKEVLCTLINKLAENDIKPIYITSTSNKASLSLARSLGFEADAFEYNYVFRRK